MTSVPPDGWVPVERRWLGLDSRTIVPALVVVALALLAQFVLPAVNAALAYDDPVRPGDQITVRGGITFTPAVGWGIEQGFRTGEPGPSGSYPNMARVVSGPSSFRVETGPFEGTATQLLAQIDQTSALLNFGHGPQVTSAPVQFRTSSGLEGVLAHYQTIQLDGVVAAFVVDGLGVKVVARVPNDVGTATTRDVATMIASIAHQEGTR
jgi:hypothetical protein